MRTTEQSDVDSVAVELPARRAGWFAQLSPATRDALALAILTMAVLLPVYGLMRSPGAVMEEGFMLTFPERLLRGEIPNVDFLHLYGPGGLWVLAGLFKVFGTDLVVERIWGLLQIAGVVFGVYFLARRWGRRVALTCGLLSLIVILPPLGYAALAWTGGVAFAVLGVLVALAARDRAQLDGRARGLAILAGVLLGAALLYRIDLVVAVGLAVAVVTWKAPRRFVVPLLTALAITTALYFVHIAMAGFHDSFQGMVIDPLFNLRGGRHLPVPPSWGHYDGYLQNAGDSQLLSWPIGTLTGPHQLFLEFFVLLGATALLLGVAVRHVRRHAASAAGRALLAVALLSAGTLPQALQRPDSTHVAWAGCVSIAFIPIALFELLRDPPRWLAGITRPLTARRWTPVVACALPVLLFVLVLPNFTVRRYVDFVAWTFGRHRHSYAIEHEGRTFYYGNPTVAMYAQQAVDKLDQIEKPGKRLFVGTGDLRKTPFSEAWLYYLFPELRPGTYYIEMDPGVANAKDSGLAGEVHRSDYVILSTVWDGWDEPNDSRKFGPDKPNQVLRKEFCQVGDFGGLYRLYQRC